LHIVLQKKTKKPISKIVEDYFMELKDQSPVHLPKDLEELYGIFEGLEVPSKTELRKMFHEAASLDGDV
jgi:hypothetical protein